MDESKKGMTMLRMLACIAVLMCVGLVRADEPAAAPDQPSVLSSNEVTVDARGSIVRSLPAGEKEFVPTDFSWDKRDAVPAPMPKVGTPQPEMKRPKGITPRQWAAMQKANEDAKYRKWRRLPYEVSNNTSGPKLNAKHRQAPAKLTVVEKRRAMLVSNQK